MQSVSLKSKDIITIPNHFETKTIRTAPNSLQLWLENKENNKGNTNISAGNNSNCCTKHKHSKVMFFISPREVGYTHVSKSQRTFKEMIGASFKVSACTANV